MPPETMTAWINLYAATFVLALLCGTIALIATAAEIFAGTIALPTKRYRDQAMLLPRIWFRWQLNYLRGTPVLLLIAFLYAQHLGFETLGNV